MLGSKLGKILSAKGKANSMKGIIRNIEKGTNRNKSDTVRRSCLRSRRVNVEPVKVRPSRLRAVLTSAIRSYGMFNLLYLFRIEEKVRQKIDNTCSPLCHSV